jgi:hypothetical protein
MVVEQLALGVANQLGDLARELAVRDADPGDFLGVMILSL